MFCWFDIDGNKELTTIKMNPELEAPKAQDIILQDCPTEEECDAFLKAQVLIGMGNITLHRLFQYRLI